MNKNQILAAIAKLSDKDRGELEAALGIPARTSGEESAKRLDSVFARYGLPVAANDAPVMQTRGCRASFRVLTKEEATEAVSRKGGR